MTILDANGLIHCLSYNKPLPDSPFIVTEELREECETALVVNGNRSLILEEAANLPGYDEAYYLTQYAHYLNTFSEADLACMRGITDVTILALVSSILNEFGSTQQTQLELEDREDTPITVISNDKALTKRLAYDFGKKVIIINPTTL